VLTGINGPTGESTLGGIGVGHSGRTRGPGPRGADNPLRGSHGGCRGAPPSWRRTQRDATTKTARMVVAANHGVQRLCQPLVGHRNHRGKARSHLRDVSTCGGVCTSRGGDAGHRHCEPSRGDAPTHNLLDAPSTSAKQLRGPKDALLRPRTSVLKWANPSDFLEPLTESNPLGFEARKEGWGVAIKQLLVLVGSVSLHRPSPVKV